MIIHAGGGGVEGGFFWLPIPVQYTICFAPFFFYSTFFFLLFFLSLLNGELNECEYNCMEIIYFFWETFIFFLKFVRD